MHFKAWLVTGQTLSGLAYGFWLATAGIYFIDKGLELRMVGLILGKTYMCAATPSRTPKTIKGQTASEKFASFRSNRHPRPILAPKSKAHYVFQIPPAGL